MPNYKDVNRGETLSDNDDYVTYQKSTPDSRALKDSQDHSVDEPIDSNERSEAEAESQENLASEPIMRRPTRE